MNVVGNYKLVRDVCLALQAGRVVRAAWREVGPYMRISGKLTFLSLTEPGLRGVTGKVHDDAYEAAAEFVRRIGPNDKVRVSV
jgi:hypothetical protein